MNETFRIDDPYAFLTKEFLEKEYVQNHLTDKQISNKYGIGSKVTIWRRRKYYGIGNIKPNKSNSNARKNRRFEFGVEDAAKWKDAGLTYPDIAKILGCSRIVVCRRYKELGLVKEIPQAQNKLHWHNELTDVQNRFILGTLLGDGNLMPGGMFQCNHSSKQRDYIRWKCEILKPIMSPLFELKPSNIQLNGKTYEVMCMRTMQNKHLKEIYLKYYPNKQKIFPYSYLIESNFDAFSLAVWYMDDGGLSSDGKACNLFTYGFGPEGTNEARGYILGKFNVTSSKYDDKARPIETASYIHFSVSESFSFFSLIAPYTHPSMAYKLPETFRQQAGLLLPQNNPV